MDAIGLRLVKSFLVENKVNATIDEDSIYDEAKEAYTWSLDFFNKHKKLPEPKQVEENLGITFEKDTDDFEYVVELVDKRKLGKYLEHNVKDALKLMEKRKPETALSILQGLTYTGRVSKEATSYKGTVEERYKEYARITKPELGIETPWKQLTESIQGWMNGTLSVVLARQNVGKAQPIHSKVITPTGWRKIGDLQVGDCVYSADGLPTEVLNVFPQGQKKCIKITFSDNTQIICCTEHLWKVKHNRKTLWEVVTADKLFLKFRVLSKGNYYEIPLTQPVEFEKQEYTIDPYFMGILISEGGVSNNAFSFTNSEKDVVERVRKSLPKDHYLNQRPNDPITYDISSMLIRNKVKDECDRLYFNGATSDCKFIPTKYLRGSVEQRIQLLQGLMDGDGTVDSKGCLSYSTVSNQLSKDVQELVNSLGGTAKIDIKKGKYNGKRHLSWRITIKLPKYIEPFYLLRKKDTYNLAPKIRKVRRTIKSMEYVQEEECVCIKVANPSHLYLTENFIVTHNTWFLCICADHCLKLGINVLFISLEMAQKRISRRIDSVYFEIPFKRLRDLKLEPEDEKKFKEVEMKGEIQIADKQTVRKVSDVVGLCRTYKPDIVFIDGGYRFEADDSRKGHWESTVNIINQLQLNAEATNIPWVVSSQYGDASDKDTKTTRGPKMKAWKVRYGKEWVINPDVVIGIHQDDDLRMMGLSEIHRLKMRDAAEEFTDSEFQIHWDMQKMNFSEKSDTEETGMEVKF